MSTPHPVTDFYERIWNAGDLSAIPQLLTEGFEFRGSLGIEMRGRESFQGYVRSIHEALGEYRCEILDGVTEGDRVFARTRFSGIHRGVFRGYQPTGKSVQWDGAALFQISNGRISSLWVLGDLAGLDALLCGNAAIP